MPGEKRTSEQAAAKALREDGFVELPGEIPKFYDQLAWRIREGDYPATIVRQLYGEDDPEIVAAIVEANPDLDMTDLKVGDLLNIPPTLHGPTPIIPETLSEELAGPGLPLLYRPKKVAGIMRIYNPMMERIPEAFGERADEVDTVVQDPRVSHDVRLKFADLTDLMSTEGFGDDPEVREAMNQALHFLINHQDRGNVESADEILKALRAKLKSGER